jgi:regulator of sirC expression with transglutaminase-like and TPR domain
VPARTGLIVDLVQAIERGPEGLASAALLLCRIESPQLDIDPALRSLSDLGRRAAVLVASAGASIRERLAAVTHLLFDVEGFRGDREHYDDIRNSLLPVVLERRRGIPISLAVVYLTVARAAGLEIMGVAFPGHFLMRAAPDAGHEAHPLILDPFAGGRELDRAALERLLARHAGEDARLEPGLLLPCDSRQIIVRMLNNMKRLYVSARSFPQAWQVADLLVALDRRPEDLRDRGLLAYHLDDFPAALLDLEAYLGRDHEAEADSDERRQLREHVQALRRRVAGMN